MACLSCFPFRFSCRVAIAMLNWRKKAGSGEYIETASAEVCPLAEIDLRHDANRASSQPASRYRTFLKIPARPAVCGQKVSDLDFPPAQDPIQSLLPPRLAGRAGMTLETR